MGEADGAAQLSSGRPGWLNWRIIPSLLVTFAVLYLLVRYLAGADEFLAALATADFRLLPLAFVWLFANLLLSAVRWRLILRAMGHRIGMLPALNAILSAWPVAVLTPSRAGDIVRAFSVRDRVPVMAGAGSVVAEKVIDIQSLCCVTLVGTLISGMYLWAGLAGALLVGAWTAIFVLAKGRTWVLKIRLLRPLHDKLTRLLSAFDALLSAPKLLLAVVATSVTAWIFALAILYTLLQVTGAGISLPTTVALWPLAVFVGVLPLTLAGMGTRDAAFLYLLILTLGEVDRGAVIAATIGYSLIGAWVFGIIGIPFTIRLFLSRGAAAKPTAARGNTTN